MTVPSLPCHSDVCRASIFANLVLIVSHGSFQQPGGGKKKNKHTAAHVSVRWRFTPHGCFSPERGVLKPTGGVTQIFNKRPQDLWRIYGSIGTFSGLLILPVAKSSCEIVARLTEFWELSP